MKSTDSQIPGADIVLPEVKMHLHRPKEPAIARIHRTEPCTCSKPASFVRHIEFDVSGTELVGNVIPGQSFGIVAPGEDAKGRPNAVRLYSTASPSGGEDGDGRIISTTVKRLIDEHWDDHGLFLGVCSNFLCDLKEGDEVRIAGPNGKRFLLPVDKGAHDYIFFATGTGIAPFRAMVIDLLRSGHQGNIALIMGAPYATDLLYHDFFEKMAVEHSNFHYLTAISRERQADGEGKLYVQDRIATHSDLLGPMLQSDRTLVYICGIAGMELGIFKEMATDLPAQVFGQYVQVDEEAMADIAGWNRKMLNRQVRPTKKIFLEVYA